MRLASAVRRAHTTMPSPARLHCFVASAFDRPDVDAFYLKVIRSSLKALNIQPMVVNRIEHNQNIDLKIVELIGKADLMIVDLTYARPSVYYEAGFGERMTPVIYTARHDHFRQTDNDPNGNLCVHFDLTKKNIISWKERDFAIAKRKLMKRITLVASPLFAKLAKRNLEHSRDHEFAALSQKKRFEKVYETVSATLMRKKYRLEELRDRDKSIFFQFTKVSRNTLFILNCRVGASTTKADLMFISSIISGFLGIPARYEAREQGEIKPRSIKKIVFVWMPISLRPASKSTLYDIFPTYDVLGDGKHLRTMITGKSSAVPRSGRVHICVVDGQSNDQLFDQSVRVHLQLVEGGRA